MSIDYQLTLDYQLQSGWLEPFVQGLQQSKVVAMRCKACRKTTYPPVHACHCHLIEAEWVTLSGKARIVHRCDGTEGSFALVQFDGADTQTVVRLNDMALDDVFGYLQATIEQNESTQTTSHGPKKLPAMVLAPRQSSEHHE